MAVIDSVLSPEMIGKIEYSLYKDDDDAEKQWAHPPYLLLYGLDGKLYPYMIFMNQFKD